MLAVSPSQRELVQQLTSSPREAEFVIIDPKSHTPIYRQIVEQVHSAIKAGVYRPGKELLSHEEPCVHGVCR